jgi:hypothetical protein
VLVILFPKSTAHQYHSIVEATMAQLPQRDICMFWRADHPPRQVLVFKGVQVLCSMPKAFHETGHKVTRELLRFFKSKSGSVLYSTSHKSRQLLQRH